MPRPEHIPQDVWLAAKGGAVRFATDAEVTRMAEMLLRRVAGAPEQANEDRVQWQPWLTYRQTRLIRDALMEHDTVMDDDVSCLFGLREWFESQTLTGER